MILTASVKQVTNKTKNYLSTINKTLDVVPLQRISSPSRVEITEDEHGYFLFHYDDKGEWLADQWFPSLEEAKRQAQWEFNISDGDWSKVSP